MNAYDAAERAYKNGYEQGKKDATASIVPCKNCTDSEKADCPTGRVWCKTLARYMNEEGYCCYGKSKENIVGERIQGVYIVRDVKKEASIDNKDVYEFAFETALVIQIENRCYAFWRHLIFDRIFIKDCKNMEEVLRTIKSVEEIQEEAQVENPYIVTVERSIEEL